MWGPSGGPLWGVPESVPVLVFQEQNLFQEQFLELTVSRNRPGNRLRNKHVLWSIKGGSIFFR